MNCGIYDFNSMYNALDPFLSCCPTFIDSNSEHRTLPPRQTLAHPLNFLDLIMRLVLVAPPPPPCPPLSLSPYLWRSIYLPPPHPLTPLISFISSDFAELALSSKVFAVETPPSRLRSVHKSTPASSSPSSPFGTSKKSSSLNPVPPPPPLAPSMPPAIDPAAPSVFFAATTSIPETQLSPQKKFRPGSGETHEKQGCDRDPDQPDKALEGLISTITETQPSPPGVFLWDDPCLSSVERSASKAIGGEGALLSSNITCGGASNEVPGKEAPLPASSCGEDGSVVEMLASSGALGPFCSDSLCPASFREVPTSNGIENGCTEEAEGDHRRQAQARCAVEEEPAASAEMAKGEIALGQLEKITGVSEKTADVEAALSCEISAADTDSPLRAPMTEERGDVEAVTKSFLDDGGLEMATDVRLIAPTIERGGEARADAALEENPGTVSDVLLVAPEGSEADGGVVMTPARPRRLAGKFDAACGESERKAADIDAIGDHQPAGEVRGSLLKFTVIFFSLSFALL